MTVQEAIEAWDPDHAEREIHVTERGWFAVPARLPRWLQMEPALVEMIPLFVPGDPCD